MNFLSRNEKITNICLQQLKKYFSVVMKQIFWYLDWLAVVSMIAAFLLLKIKFKKCLFAPLKNNTSMFDVKFVNIINIWERCFFCLEFNVPSCLSSIIWRKKHNFKTFVKPKRIHNNVGMLEMYLNVQFCEFHSKWPQMLFPLLKLITFKGRE